MNSLFNLRKQSSTSSSTIKQVELFDNWDDDIDLVGFNKSKKVKKEFDSDTCPLCFNSDCLDISDLISCTECGYVISRPFDNSAEYRYFSQEDRGCDPTRVGAPQDPRLPEASLGTVILNGYGTHKRDMINVKKYQTWNAVPYKERSFMQTCERLSLIGLNYGINNSIIEETKTIYTTLQGISGRQGLSRDALLSACLYMSLKQTGSPRKPNEIADIFGLTKAVFTKALKQMQQQLAMARQKGKINNSGSTKTSQASTRAVEYIELPLSKLSIPRNQIESLKMLCKRVAEKAEESSLNQAFMPPSLAAGCLAFVIKRCDTLDISIKTIAKESNISKATLEKCLRKLEEQSEILELVI
jgi:transcription initiation factor TFIIIB Brf1 subunit/transcription initiation factor TFIIB